jgi:hypothetical protein
MMNNQVDRMVTDHIILTQKPIQRKCQACYGSMEFISGFPRIFGLCEKSVHQGLGVQILEV